MRECSEEVQRALTTHGAGPDSSPPSSKRKLERSPEGESSITRLIPIDEAGEEEKQTHGAPKLLTSILTKD